MKRYFVFILFLMAFPGALISSCIVDAQPIDRRILVVMFDDGYVRNHGYHETGANDTVFRKQLEIVKAVSILNYAPFCSETGE